MEEKTGTTPVRSEGETVRAPAPRVDAAGACIGCGSLMLSHGEFCAVCRAALAAYAAMKCR